MGLFTYIGDLSTDLDKVRFYLQDTTENYGPKPADANFTDGEISGLLTAEGSVGRAVAAGFETLATAWTLHPTFSADGASVSNSEIAKGFREQAQSWRSKFGFASSGVGSRALTRVDGYSDDIDSHET